MNKQEASYLLNQTCLDIAKHNKINNEIYAILLSLFPTVLSSALEILDSGKVIKIQCQNTHRVFYRVREPLNKNRSSLGNNNQGDKEDQYDVMGDFCLCYYYQRECLYDSGSSFFCKHVLACKLAQALQTYTVKEIEDIDFAPLFLGSRRHLNKYDDNKRYQ